MNATGVGASALERLRAAHHVDAGVDELLDLADAAIEKAAAAADRETLEQIAVELDVAAEERGAAGRGLAIAAARARATLPSAAAAPAPTQSPTQATEGPAPAPVAEPRPAEPALAYASWGRRVGAFLVDWALLLLVVAPLLGSVAGVESFAALFLLLPFLYFTLLQAGFGRTLGKLVFGIAVQRADGRPLGLGAAAARTGLQAILAFTVIGFIVDAIQPLPDARNQALHDKPPKTVVVRAPVRF